MVVPAGAGVATAAMVVRAVAAGGRRRGPSGRDDDDEEEEEDRAGQRGSHALRRSLHPMSLQRDIVPASKH